MIILYTQNIYIPKSRMSDLMPLTDVASKWQFVLAICSSSLQGVASSSLRLLQLLQHVAYHVLTMVYLQQFMFNDMIVMTIFNKWEKS